MSKMKAFAERISLDMGYDGEITPAVIEETNRILKDYGLHKHLLSEPEPEIDIIIEVDDEF